MGQAGTRPRIRRGRGQDGECNFGAGGNEHQRAKWAGENETQKTKRAESRIPERSAQGRAEDSRFGAGGDEKQRSGTRGRRPARGGGRGLCLLLRCTRRLHRPHAPAVPRRPGCSQPLTRPALAMAEAASGAGSMSLEGERGKRPPPEGEPAAPASGVLGRCAVARSVRVAGA